MSNIKSSRFYQIIFFILLGVYLAMSIRTELWLIKMKPDDLLEDFGFYERGLNFALDGKDPYSIRSIGPGFLYPPSALFIIEAFHYIESIKTKFILITILNISLIASIVSGIAKYYGYSIKKIWFWYVLSFGFAPFLELLFIGQINVITLFGIFMLFFFLDSSSILSGFGLSLAILTKVSPFLFWEYLVISKKVKGLAASMVWMIIIISLAALRYGITPILEYPKVLQWLSNQFIISNNSQSLVSKLSMTFGFPLHSSEHQAVQIILMFYILLVILISSILTVFGKQPKEPLFIITSFGMTISPNVMWYHHYVFILLPFLIWMGWKRLDLRVIAWCFLGLLIIQVDRFSLTAGLLNHIFIHISILMILFWQIQHLYNKKKLIS